jgi:hypothetical protein
LVTPATAKKDPGASRKIRSLTVNRPSEQSGEP